MKAPSSLLLAAVLAACASPTGVTLRPAPEAQLIAAGPRHAAPSPTATVADVQLTVLSLAWPGSAPIQKVVTPMRVRLENASSQPISFRYRDVALVAPSGQSFAAVPPFAVEGTVPTPRLLAGHPVVSRPDFVGRGFAVSPLYAPAYPGTLIAEEAADYDPVYYTRFRRYWENVALPTAEMLREALPEGTLARGGSVEGYLYFEKVAPGVPRVELRLHVNQPGGREALGIIEIPFLAAVP